MYTWFGSEFQSSNDLYPRLAKEDFFKLTQWGAFTVAVTEKEVKEGGDFPLGFVDMGKIEGLWNSLELVEHLTEDPDAPTISVCTLHSSNIHHLFKALTKFSRNRLLPSKFKWTPS